MCAYIDESMSGKDILRVIIGGSLRSLQLIYTHVVMYKFINNVLTRQVIRETLASETVQYKHCVHLVSNCGRGGYCAYMQRVLC